MKHHSEDLLSGILFTAIATAVLTQLPSIKITKIAMTSRMIPEICVILLYGFGAIQLMRWMIRFLNDRRVLSSSLERKEKTDVTGKPGAAWKGYARVGLCLAFFAIFILLLRPIGFILSGIFYLFASFFVLVPNAYRKKTVYCVSVVFPILTYFLFTRAFSIILPTGTLW